MSDYPAVPAPSRGRRAHRALRVVDHSDEDLRTLRRVGFAIERPLTAFRNPPRIPLVASRTFHDRLRRATVKDDDADTELEDSDFGPGTEGVTMASHANNSNMFPSFLDTSGNSNAVGIPRQSPSPGPQHANSQMNGANMAAANIMAPLPAGHQADIEYIYSMVVELSAELKKNRELTSGIVRDAEEVMRRYNSSGGQPTLNEVGEEITAGRVRELERELAKEKKLVEIYKREQVENTKLIGEYETAVGTMTQQIREYCTNNKMNYLAQTRHYNNLLQKEKDDHLQSRLERDEWHAKTLKVCGMIRHAKKLADEEFADHITVISGLQAEVRIFRKVIGLEKQAPEEETGWSYLKEVSLNVEGVDET